MSGNFFADVGHVVYALSVVVLGCLAFGLVCLVVACLVSGIVAVVDALRREIDA